MRTSSPIFIHCVTVCEWRGPYPLVRVLSTSVHRVRASARTRCCECALPPCMESISVRSSDHAACGEPGVRVCAHSAQELAERPAAGVWTSCVLQCVYTCFPPRGAHGGPLRRRSIVSCNCVHVRRLRSAQVWCLFIIGCTGCIRVPAVRLSSRAVVERRTSAAGWCGLGRLDHR